MTVLRVFHQWGTVLHVVCPTDADAERVRELAAARDLMTAPLVTLDIEAGLRFLTKYGE